MKSKLKDMSISLNGNIDVKLELLGKKAEDIEQITKYEFLDVNIKKFSEKRSINANAYFHVLNDQLAKAHNISRQYCKNTLMHKYGTRMMIGEEPMIYKTNATPEYMMELEEIHTYPIKSDGNATYYQVYKHTAEYNTEEMATLINGTVEECKLQGIPTETQEMVDRMLERWGVK